MDDNKMVLAACLPLPPSANEANGYNSRTKTRFKTKKVLNFREEVYNIINLWPRLSVAEREKWAPYYILHMDLDAMEKAQWAYKSRSKAALAARRWYELEIEEYTIEDRRDSDNGHKEAQDAIIQAISFINDKRIVRISRRTIVDKDGFDHCEIILRECQRIGKSGDLLRKAAAELSLDLMYTAPYGATHDHSPVVDRAG
jgi:Holliday junction resolvase RusA-like endonuclease